MIWFSILYFPLFPLWLLPQACLTQDLLAAMYSSIPNQCGAASSPSIPSSLSCTSHPTTAIQQLPMHPMHDQIKSYFQSVLISRLFINVVGWISPDRLYWNSHTLHGHRKIYVVTPCSVTLCYWHLSMCCLIKLHVNMLTRFKKLLIKK